MSENKQLASSKKTVDYAATLKRAIGLPRLVLYGLGTTIGAGIYVLVGETAGRAGIYAPISFLVSAVVMAFSAASFAEFSGRIPQSAGEAVYIDQGFRKPWLAAISGYAIILAAVVAAAAISLGCAGYVAQLVPLPIPVIVSIIFLVMGSLAVWGIQESITIAAVLTVIEVIGLLVIIAAGWVNNPQLFVEATHALPSLSDGLAWGSILSASLIAFFAFIGFDDVVNVVEETIDPARIMPWAIGITLVTVTVLYILVSVVALDALPMDELSASRAPIGLLFERLTGISPTAITLIAIAATMNGIVIQIIMGSRVAYGLGKKNYLPAKIASVYPLTRTPLIATVMVTVAALLFALFVPLDRLAEFTSQLILFIFALVNISLMLIKLRNEPAPENTFTVNIFVPMLGATSCIILLTGPLLF
ncbi:MAG: amino acid permease [Rhizobiaceae bacterium]|nr:amino acid permease [Rhizobiaceae bacterium]